jgi:D-ribose pyranase
MKKTFLLNAQISRIIAELGHTQGIVIADCGLPIPKGIERIDLAVCAGIPSFIDVLGSVLSEMKVEKALFAKELKDNDPFFQKLADKIGKANGKVIFDFCPHKEFKTETFNCAAIIRTGEQTSYANVILYSGVTF